jgi:hypothetical protein
MRCICLFFAFVASMLQHNTRIALCMATLLCINRNAFSCLKLYLNDKTSSAHQQSWELPLTTALLIF